MEPRQVRSAADARAIVEARDLPHVKVGAFDIDGIMRGKYMSRDKFLSALEGGFGFCDVVLGWDCQDQLYDNVKFTGWHTGYPDGLSAGAAAPRDRAWSRARVRGVCRVRV
jgi:glutamine synthetase